MDPERFQGEVRSAQELDAHPPEYRTAISKIVVSHAVNELKGALTFDEPAIRLAPTPKFKWLVSRNTMEEFGHHILFARLADELHAPWKDKKSLTLFDFPVVEWVDFGVIKATVDIAELIELDDLVQCTYLPLRKVAKDTYPEEKFHVGLGREIISTLLDEDPGNRERINATLARLFPEALDFFGAAHSKNNELFVHWGLKRRSNSAMRADYVRQVQEFARKYELKMPDVPAKYAGEIPGG